MHLLQRLGFYPALRAPLVLKQKTSRQKRKKIEKLHSFVDFKSFKYHIESFKRKKVVIDEKDAWKEVTDELIELLLEVFLRLDIKLGNLTGPDRKKKGGSKETRWTKGR